MSNTFINGFDDVAFDAFEAAGIADMATCTVEGVDLERRALVNTGVQTLGEYGQIMTPRTVIGFYIADGAIARGTSYTIDGTAYETQRIDDIDLNDGSIQWWSMKDV